MTATKKEEKNKGGRPPKYSSTDALEIKIAEYLLLCEKTKQMPNKAGLCMHLGIVKDTYCEWKKNVAKFSDSIKAFENITENSWVQRLGGNSPTGAIFYLKNAFKEDYRERQEIEHSGVIDTDKETKDRADKIIDVFLDGITKNTKKQ